MARTYPGLAAHDMIRFSIRIMFTGTWTEFDTFSLFFDDRMFRTYSPYAILPQCNPYQCGTQNIASYANSIVGRAFHTGSELTMKLSWNFTSNTPPQIGVAIKEVVMGFAMKTSNDVEDFLFTNSPGSTDNIACQAHHYSYFGPTWCQPVNSICIFSSGPTDSDCYIVDFSASFDGTRYINCGSNCIICQDGRCLSCINSCLAQDGTCSSSCSLPHLSYGDAASSICVDQCPVNQFLFWNITCQSTCAAPLIKSNDLALRGICDYPCPTSVYSWLYWNGSCLPTCPYDQRNENNHRFCDACQPNYYLYDTGRCFSVCSERLNATTIGGSKFCKSPCQAGSYLYWNNSCLPTCPYAHRTENSYDYCDSCPSGSYLYDNGNCLPSCHELLNSTIIQGSHFCLSPCSPSQFIYTDKSCHATCPEPHKQTIVEGVRLCGICNYPYRLTSNKSCELDLSPDQARQAHGISSATNVADLGLDISSSLVTLIGSHDATMFCYVSFTKMLFTIRYMNIAYPPMLQKVLDEQNPTRSPLSLINHVAQNLKSTYASDQLPWNFGRYGLHSRFLINFLPPLISISVILLVVLGVWVSLLCTKKYKGINTVLEKTLMALRWNFVMTFLLSNYDGLIIFSSLEFHSAHLNQTVSVISIILAIVFSTAVLLIFIKTSVIVIEIIHDNTSHKQDTTSQSGDDLKQRHKRYEVYYENFKSSTLDRQAFLVLFSCKISLYYLIISYLYTNPLLQAALLVVLDIFMLLYLLIRRPFVQKLKLINHVIQEVILLVANICVLALAVYDYRGEIVPSTRQSLGSMILFCNIAFRAVGLVLTVLQLVFVAKRIYDVYVRRRSQIIQDVSASNIQLAEQSVSVVESSVMHQAQRNLSDSRLIKSGEGGKGRVEFTNIDLTYDDEQFKKRIKEIEIQDGRTVVSDVELKSSYTKSQFMTSQTFKRPLRPEIFQNKQSSKTGGAL